MKHSVNQSGEPINKSLQQLVPEVTNRVGEPTILLFDLTVSPFPLPDEIETYEFDVTFAADDDGARDA